MPYRSNLARSDYCMFWSLQKSHNGVNLISTRELLVTIFHPEIQIVDIPYFWNYGILEE